MSAAAVAAAGSAVDREREHLIRWARRYARVVAEPRCEQSPDFIEGFNTALAFLENDLILREQRERGIT